MNIATIYCVECSLTFTEYEYETTNACPYCSNDDDGKLLDVNGDFDLITEGEE